jgi:hypothetical protein
MARAWRTRFVPHRGPVRGWVIYDRLSCLYACVPGVRAWATCSYTGADLFIYRYHAAGYAKILNAKNPPPPAPAAPEDRD